MLTIISIEDLEGFHPFESQSHRTSVWLEGYVKVPEHLITKLFHSCGYCDLVFDDNDNLVDIIPTEKPQFEPVVEPLTVNEEQDIMIMDLEYRLTMLELGL